MSARPSPWFFRSLSPWFRAGRISACSGLALLVVGSGQFLEGNVLSPKLVGESVGLHPVWLIFALFAFGSLMGFSGMIIAVPLAAAVGVLIRFAVRRYKQSALFSGVGLDSA